MPATSTASFLFCDLVGSTALLTRIGDDAGDDVRRRCFGAFREAVAEHRGVEVKTMGDGMLALFSNSVGDAIGCGIAMQRGIAQLARESPLLGLRLRVGVAVGEAGHEEDDWFGTPVIEAARLCAAARSGQILVTDLARQLVGSRGAYRFSSLGAVELKGLEPTLVSEVAWEPEPGQSVVPLPAALERRRQGVFVGRKRERAVLEAAWRRADAGRLAAVVVTGEQGIGKTVLVAESARSIHAQGGTVLYGRCGPDVAEPYEAFSDALAWYVATAPTAALRAQLGPTGGELVRIIPSLITRFTDMPPPDAERSGARRRLFDAVETLLSRAATASPMLLVLDDLHLAQPPTLALLTDVIERCVGTRLALVAVATTSADQPAPLNALPSGGEVEVVALDGLTDADVEVLVSASTGRSPAEVADQAAALRAETDGNPALIAQLLEEVDRTGVTAVSLPCPYKGLASFQPEDQELFFGREEVVGALLARLASAPLLGIVGASGSGKSSVVRAGLLPGVWRGALPGSGAWRTVVMAPGPHPLAELAAQVALLLHKGPAGLLQELEHDHRALDLATRQLLVGANPDARLLLVIDQFEELFTICEDASEREQFLDAVLYAVGSPRARTSAVVVMRADFYGHAASSSALAAALESNHALLGPMREDELRAAVERPARHVGLRLEPGLADAVVADVIDQPGGLPLLSHALVETWKGRSGRTLTLSAYRGVGGARGALARTADTVVAGMNPDEQAIARNLFIRLVEVGDGTDDTSRRAELRELNPGDDPKVAAVLQQLVDSRLLTAGESTVEIAHEALIRGWPRLRDWLDEDREGLRLLSHLRASAHEWDRLGRDAGELQRGVRLAATLDWVNEAHPQLDDVERQYLDAGRAAEEAELDAARRQARRDASAKRRLRTLLAATALLLVAVLIAGLFAVRQRNRAEDAASARDAAATLAEARRSGAQALVAPGYDQALLLGVEGRHLHESPETNFNLLAAIQRSPYAVGVISGSQAGGVDLAFTPDGKTLFASGAGGDPGLSAFDVSTRRRQAFLAGAGNGPAVRSAVSLDGGLAVVADEVGHLPAENPKYELRVVDAGTLTDTGPPLAVSDEYWPPTRLSFSADGTRVAAVRGSNFVFDREGAEARVWDVTRGGEAVLRFPLEGAPGESDVVFLPGSTSILAAGRAGTSVVDISTGQEIHAIDGAFAPLALSPDGGTLAATLDPSTAADIGLFDVSTGEPTATFASGHSERITRLAFSPDGSTLASGGEDHLVVVWDVGTATRRSVLRGHAAPVRGLAFSPDGFTLASGGDDQALYLWDLLRDDTLDHQVPPGVVPPTPAFPIGAIAASPDGTHVTYISSDFNRLQIRDVATGALSAPIDAGGGPQYGSSMPIQGVERRYVTITARDEGSPRQQPVTVKIWDRETGGVVAEGLTAEPAEEVVFKARLTPDGRRLVIFYLSGGNVSHLDVLDATTLQPVGGPPLALDGVAWEVSYTPDVRQAVVGLTHPDTDRPPDGLVIDLEDRRIDRTVTLEELSGIQGTAIGSEGRTIAFSDDTGSVVIVDAATGRKSQVLEAHDGPFVGISFAPDEATFVTAGADGTVKLWDTSTREPLGTVRPLGTNRIAAATFLDEGRVLIYFPTGEIFEWDPRPDAWEAYACRVAGRNLSRAEWADLVPDRPYQVTCPDHPPGT
jgi:WD40 repeat protein/class 3 adenylate cyclase